MFSVVIPLYNKENSIQRTLECVLIQSLRDFEVLIINDGSTDHSAEIVSKYIPFDSRIRLIHKENGGVCSARNLGIEKSTFSYISFLDADDLWESTYLEEQRNLINDFSDAAMWGINFAPVKNGVKEYLHTGLPDNYRGYILDYFSMKRVSDLFCSSSVVIRKNAFDVVGLFDTRIKYSEDLDMWYRILLNFPVAFFSKTMVYYILDAENRALRNHRKLKEFLPFFIDKYEIYKNNYSFYSYIHRWSAVLIRNYYFKVKKERSDAYDAAMRLNYSIIPRKYRYMLRTPYFIGRIIYTITTFKQRIMSTSFNRIRSIQQNKSSIFNSEECGFLKKCKG